MEAAVNGEDAAAGVDADGQPLSKSALKKLKAKEEKAKKKAEHKKEEGKGGADEAGMDQLWSETVCMMSSCGRLHLHTFTLSSAM